VRIPSRVLLLALLWFIASPIGFSQTESHADEKNLYSVALFTSIERMDTEWEHLGVGDSTMQTRIDYHHMVVQKDPEITDKLPVKRGEYNVEYLDDREIFARRKDMIKDFATLKIFPIANNDNVLKIDVTVYWAGIKKGKHMYGLSDWSDVTFRYDCDKKEFVVSNVKLGGI